MPPARSMSACRSGLCRGRRSARPCDGKRYPRRVTVQVRLDATTATPVRQAMATRAYHRTQGAAGRAYETATIEQIAVEDAGSVFEWSA